MKFSFQLYQLNDGHKSRLLNDNYCGMTSKIKFVLYKSAQRLELNYCLTIR